MMPYEIKLISYNLYSLEQAQKFAKECKYKCILEKVIEGEKIYNINGKAEYTDTKYGIIIEKDYENENEDGDNILINGERFYVGGEK